MSVTRPAGENDPSRRIDDGSALGKPLEAQELYKALLELNLKRLSSPNPEAILVPLSVLSGIMGQCKEGERERVCEKVLERYDGIHHAKIKARCIHFLARWGKGSQGVRKTVREALGDDSTDPELLCFALGGLKKLCLRELMPDDEIAAVKRLAFHCNPAVSHAALRVVRAGVEPSSPNKRRFLGGEFRRQVAALASSDDEDVKSAAREVIRLMDSQTGPSLGVPEGHDGPAAKL